MLTVRRLLLATLLAFLIFPPSAGAAMEFALQDDDVFVHQRGYDRDRALDHAVALGATRIRVNVLWARTLVSGGSTHPVYDFSAIDALQAAAEERGIALQLTLAGPAPAWATRDRRVGNFAPDPVKFGAFAGAVAEHFAGRVDRYSIWNEPNWSTWLAPAQRSASLYRKLCRAIAPLKFLRDLTPRGSAPLKADGFALHPYQFMSAPTFVAGKPDDVTIGTLSRLTRALDALGRRHALTTPKGRPLDLYLTEFGYLTVGSRAQRASVRATWLTSALAVARRNPRVRQLLQYQLVDPPAGALWHSAILTRGGFPQPAYKALVRALNT
jgi:hypothetical protein